MLAQRRSPGRRTVAAAWNQRMRRGAVSVRFRFGSTATRVRFVRLRVSLLREGVQSGSRPPILGVALTPDSRFIVTASEGAEVEILDVERRRRIDFYKVSDFPGFETPITGGAVCAGGSCAAFITANRLVHCLWWGDGKAR